MSRTADLRNAFSLIEVTIVILIMGIIAAVTAPRLFQIEQDAIESATFEQLRRLNEMAERYRVMYGDWPADGKAGEVPEDLSAWCNPSDFGTTPIGGVFKWNGLGTGSSYYGVSIVRDGSNRVDWTKAVAIDRRFDDGNTNTGYLQRTQVDGRWAYTYIYEAAANQVGNSAPVGSFSGGADVSN